MTSRSTVSRLSFAAVLGTAIMLRAASSSAANADSASVSARLPGPEVTAWQTGASRPDRLQHASLSFALSAGVGLVSDEPASAVAATISLGVLKELHDSREDHFDWGDLAADVLGSLCGGLLAHALRR